MNNTQLYLSIGIPSFVALLSWITVILAWLSNRSDIHRQNDRIDSLRTQMRSEFQDLRSEINRRFDAVDAELRFFHGFTGKLDGRVEALEKRK